MNKMKDKASGWPTTEVLLSEAVNSGPKHLYHAGVCCGLPVQDLSVCSVSLTKVSALSGMTTSGKKIIQYTHSGVGIELLSPS